MYNISNRKTEEDKKENFNGVSHGVALAELIACIEDKKYSVTVNDMAPVFKLADLVKLDTERLVELGVETTGRFHSTNLKKRILTNMPGLQGYKEGRDVLLSFNDDVGNALRNACQDDCDDESICF